MIIWSGWGILTVLFAIIGIIVGVMVGSYTGALTGCIAGGAVAALLNHLVAKALNQPKMVIDPQTQQPILIKKSNSLFFIPMAWFTPGFAAAGVLFGIIGIAGKQHDEQLTKDFPGKIVFENASDLIDSGKGSTTIHGNNADAEKAAAAFTTTFSSMQELSFTVEGKSGKKESGAFRTYCHQGKDSVIFLCHVPGMRHYKDEAAKQALAEIAWHAASAAAKDLPGVNADSTLTVGLRGFAVYGSIQQGKLDTKPTARSEEMKILYSAFDPGTAVAK